MFILAISYYFFFKRPYRLQTLPSSLTKAEEEELIAEWNPKPIDALLPIHDPLPETPVIVKVDETSVVVTLPDLAGEHTLISASSADYLNLSCHHSSAVTSKPTNATKYATPFGVNSFESLPEYPSIPRNSHPSAAEVAIAHYGVSPCGPRGFYGTMDVHLMLEKALGKFLGFPNVLVYAMGATASSTVAPVFLKRGDLAIVPADASAMTREAIKLARCETYVYDPSNTSSLEKRLATMLENDTRKAAAMRAKHVSFALRKFDHLRVAEMQRRILVIEGISPASGRVADVKGLVALAKKYRLRVLLDDTVGFGVLGPHGRGSIEAHGVSSSDVDIYVGNLGSSIGTVGAFAAGAVPTVDHMRLTSTGYVFSCALPPMFAAATLPILDALADDSKDGVNSLPRTRLAALPGKCAVAHRALEAAGARAAPDAFEDRKVPDPRRKGEAAAPKSAGESFVEYSGSLTGKLVSPLVVLRAVRNGEAATSEAFYAHALNAKRGVLVSRRSGSHGALPPSLVVHVTAAMSDDAVKDALTVAVDVLGSLDHATA